MSVWYKVVCGCDFCISVKIIYLLLLSWQDHYLKKVKDQSQNSQNRRSSGMSYRLFETYINSVMTHVCHSYQTASDMSMATMFAYSPSQHAFPHYKCVLRCC